MTQRESGETPRSQEDAEGTPYIGTELAQKRARERDGGGGSGGDGISRDMEGRVSRLETHMEHVRDDIRDIKGDVHTIASQIVHMPTKRDLETWRGQWLAIGIGIVALVVGGVVGGLSLINHYAASGSVPAPVPASQPIVIQVPQPVPVAAPVAAKPKD